MAAKGKFSVDLEPQADDSAPAGRLLINKQYSGDLVGTGVGQMISKRTESGVSAYFAVEEFEGSLDGKSGGFTLLHNGYMSPTEMSLEIKILEGSGTSEFEGITGSFQIEQKDGDHFYTFEYEF